MNQNEVNRLFQNCIEDLKALHIPIAKETKGIFLNPRAKSRFGCCKTEEKNGKKYYRIEISSFLLDGEEEGIRDVIFHELLHTCPGCMNHGAKWKSYAALVNREYGRKIRTANRYEDFALEKPEGKEESRYHIVCSRCGARIERKRKSRLVKHLKDYRCGKCGGELRFYGDITAEFHGIHYIL